MIALDTNVLVRYIVQDEPSQAKKATELIEKHCNSENPAFINLIVLCEINWVLKRAYKCSKVKLIQVLRSILLTESFLVESHDLAWKSLLDFENGTADFSDYIIGRINEVNTVNKSYTFDKKAAESVLFELLN